MYRSTAANRPPGLSSVTNSTAARAKLDWHQRCKASERIKEHFYAKQDQEGGSRQKVSPRPGGKHTGWRQRTELCGLRPWQGRRDHDRHPIRQGSLRGAVLRRSSRHGKQAVRGAVECAQGGRGREVLHPGRGQDKTGEGSWF